MDIDEFLRMSMHQNEQEAKKIAIQKRQERVAGLLQGSGLKQRFKKRTFESFIVKNENDAAYQEALYFAKYFKDCDRGLLLLGNVGTGKTHLAAAIANYLMQELYTVVFGNITDIIARIYDTYDKESEISTAEIINYLTTVDLLIIDDLGKEYATENAKALIYQIINTLYEDERLVVITTNLNSKELTERLGAATVSRITEMTIPVIMQGPDWRIKGAGQ